MVLYPRSPDQTLAHQDGMTRHAAVAMELRKLFQAAAAFIKLFQLYLRRYGWGTCTSTLRQSRACMDRLASFFKGRLMFEGVAGR